MYVLVKYSTAHWCVLLTHIHKHNYLTKSFNSKHQSPRKHFQCICLFYHLVSFRNCWFFVKGWLFVEHTNESAGWTMYTMRTMGQDENCFSNCPEVPWRTKCIKEKWITKQKTKTTHETSTKRETDTLPILVYSEELVLIWFAKYFCSHFIRW